MNAPSAEDLARLNAEREVALLRKFVSGKRLAPEEMAGLSHLLPPAVLASPPDPVAEYRHTYAHYAPLLGVDVRQIKRYVQKGYEAKPSADFPPFDEPEHFVTWWRLHHRGEPAPGIVAFTATGKKAAAATQSAPGPEPAAAAKASASAEPTAPPLRFDFTGAGGFEESVRELRITTAAAQARLRAAQQRDPLDEGLVKSCSGAVERQMDLLRKSENDLFEFQRRRGELVPRAEIREDWRTLLSALRQMRRRMADNIAADLLKSGKFAPEQIVLVKAAVETERAREDQLLRGSKFWRQPTPENAPADSSAAA